MKLKYALISALVLVSVLALSPRGQAASGSLFIGAGLTRYLNQAKLWFNDGTWWAILPYGGDASTLANKGIYFYRLEGGVFVKKGLVDSRITTRADVLWDGTNLFALMYKDSNSSPTKLYKYSYDAINKTYTLLPGFPAPLLLQGDPASAATAVLAKDSTGKLWVTYETNDVGATNGKIHVIWSTSADHTVWNTTGMALFTGVDTNDVATIAAFDGKIGVLWSNQAMAGGNFGFRVHVDGQSETTWGPVEIVAQGGDIADNHISIAVTETQDLVVATKSSVPGDHLNLFVRSHTSGTWSAPVPITANGTRPVAVYDYENKEVYVFYTDVTGFWPNTRIVYRKAKVADLVFSAPTDFLVVPGVDVNDVTSTKQAIDAGTGIVAAAQGGQNAYYDSLTLNFAPVASIAASPKSGAAPLTVTFNGSGSTDPDGTIVAYAWTFGDGGTATGSTPSHTYSVAGTYTAHLTVTDDDGATDDDTVVITVTTPAPNQSPVVNAGPDLTITLPANAVLDGTVTDDGQVTAMPTVSWSQVSGPGTVTFANASAVDTTATFDAAGTYVLRLTANDGQFTVSDDVTVTVNPASSPNQLPVVNAGSDQTIILPANAVLDGTVTDDGQVTAMPTVSWSQVSGPGTVTFANASAVDTTATFDAAGTYVLRLTANDGQFTVSDDVTVTAVTAGSTTVVEVRVAAGTDDAEQKTDGTPDLTTKNLDLGMKPVGMRFVLAVPPGAQIVQAYVQFAVDKVHSEPTALTLEGQASDDAPAFEHSKHNIVNRPRTFADVSWAPPGWTTVGAAGLAQRTPDLSAIIQEIVDRPGWASGHGMALISTGSGARQAKSFEASKTAAPLLHVEYAQ